MSQNEATVHDDGEDEIDTDPLPDHEILEEIVRALVDDPSAVRVETESDEDTRKRTLTIHVAPADRRHVIGRGGQTVMLLRQLFTTISGRANWWVGLEVFETEEERLARRGPKPVR